MYDSFNFETDSALFVLRYSLDTVLIKQILHCARALCKRIFCKCTVQSIH